MKFKVFDLEGRNDMPRTFKDQSTLLLWLVTVAKIEIFQAKTPNLDLEIFPPEVRQWLYGVRRTLVMLEVVR